MLMYKSTTHLLLWFIERRDTASSLLDKKKKKTDILLSLFASFTACCSFLIKLTYFALMAPQKRTQIHTYIDNAALSALFI